MEILINELSLDGQFNSVEHFIDAGLLPFVKTLNDIDYRVDLLYKKYDFYNSKITRQDVIYDILKVSVSRQYDELRKLKSLLDKLLINPYWEDNQKHSANDAYVYNEKNVCGSSLAEASERDKITVSFIHNDFLSRQLSIYKKGCEIKLDNLLQQGHFIEVAYRRNYIAFDIFCNKYFSNSKINFSRINPKEGFSLIKKEEEDLFFDAFKKFSELSWQQIFIDRGLYYKEYEDQGYFKIVGETIYKFRISEKYRCFGYRKDDTFFVLQFDLTHKMSD